MRRTRTAVCMLSALALLSACKEDQGGTHYPDQNVAEREWALSSAKQRKAYCDDYRMGMPMTVTSFGDGEDEVRMTEFLEVMRKMC